MDTQQGTSFSTTIEDDENAKKKGKKKNSPLTASQQRNIMIQHFESYLFTNRPDYRGHVVDVIWKDNILKVSVPADTAE